MIECIVVGAGGFFGSVCRYLIGLIPMNEPYSFPIKTFIINIIGCFVIGIAAALAAKNSSVNPKLILFLKTGICGGFTTFSSFALESGGLIRDGKPAAAILYASLSIIFGVIAVFSGQEIIK